MPLASARCAIHVTSDVRSRRMPKALRVTLYLRPLRVTCAMFGTSTRPSFMTRLKVRSGLLLCRSSRR
jgi:hypothetical protein